MSKTEEIVRTDDIIKEYKKKMWDIGDEKISQELWCIFRSQHKIVYIQTPEENRIIEFYTNMSIVEGYDIYTWDQSRGLLDAHIGEQAELENSEIHLDIIPVLDYILDTSREHVQLKTKNQAEGEGKIFLFLDCHEYINNAIVVRKLKEISHTFSFCHLVFISNEYSCPSSLEKEIKLIDFPYPSKNELTAVLKNVAEAVSTSSCPQISEIISIIDGKKKGKDKIDEIVRAASGLTILEATNAFSYAIIRKRSFHIPTIIEEKRQIIRKGGVLEYRDPRFTMDDVGGLNVVKDWFVLHKNAFREDARKFGLPVPKGSIFCGIPGVGKSMICEALASLYEMPLLRLDFGSIFQSFVGQSESRMRSALKLAAAVSPCLLWCDEIEKGISGAQSSGVTDSGVSARVMATLLTWMSEKEDPVFIVATANNVSRIPPEFMRAGRFDEIFFLDLPDENQRADVASKLLSRKKRDPEKFDLLKIAQSCNNYTPVEIEKAIDNALFIAYSEGKRELVTEDIVSEFGKFQPLYNSRRDEIEEIREWALGEDGKGGRAIKANSSSSEKIKHNFGEDKRILNIDDELI